MCRKDIKGIALDDRDFKNPRYLKEKATPVVALPGFKFGGAGFTAVSRLPFAAKYAYKDGVYLIV